VQYYIVNAQVTFVTVNLLQSLHSVPCVGPHTQSLAASYSVTQAEFLQSLVS